MVKIVSAHEVTWHEYKNLRLEALQKEPQAFGSSYEDQKNFPDEEWQNRLGDYKKSDGNWMIFALNEDQLVGMLGAFQTDEDRKNNSAQIIAVYVNDAFRGKGIAKMLMQTQFEILKKQHVQKALLYVNPLQDAAFQFYKNLGFTIISQENKKLGDGNFYDEYLMEKVL